MATFALKVSIDDSKYVIKGVDKESSKKEILCILTKYRSKNQLPELQSALSKLNDSVSLIKVKNTNKTKQPVTRHQGKSRVSGKRKGSSKHLTKKLSYGDVCSDGVTLSNDEKQRLSQCKEPVATGEEVENLKCRKRPLIWRSQSLSEKDRKLGKSHLRERPKSFGAFDTNKLVRLDHAQLLGKKENSYIHCVYKMKNRKMVESYAEGGMDAGKPNNDKSQKSDVELMTKSKKHSDLNSKRLKTQLQQNKLKNWLADLKRNSIAYFIDEFEANNYASNQMARLPSSEKPDEGKESDSALCHFKQGEEQHCAKGSECTEGNEYAETETDSGLPSLDYESSLDTLSRDDRISLEQSCDEGRTKESQNEYEFDWSSSNEREMNSNLPIERLNRVTDDNQICEFKELENLSIERELLATESNVSKESGVEEGEIIKDSRPDLAMDGSNSSKMIEAETTLFEQVKYTIDKISKTDENILHCELLISQLEFQLDILSENFDEIEDIDLEIEEMKMITELKETEEFLKAITKLSQYQREAQGEIMEELLYLDAKTKEKQIKLQSLERRLIRQRFKSVPRHLNVSREKRLYAKEVTSTIENEIDDIYVYDNGDDAISLV